MFGYKCQILRGAGPRFGSISSEPHVFLSHMHHTNPSPHQCFEDWCGATSRVLINRSAVLSCPGTSAINGPAPHHCHPHTGGGHTKFACAVCVFLYSGVRPSVTYTLVVHRGAHRWCWTALCEVFT